MSEAPPARAVRAEAVRPRPGVEAEAAGVATETGEYVCKSGRSALLDRRASSHRDTADVLVLMVHREDVLSMF